MVGTEFHKGSWFCKTCANASARANHAKRMADPEQKRKHNDRHYKAHYGLTGEEYRSKLATQTGCGICAEALVPWRGTHLDHNHTTGQIRDFLCMNCNRGLGHFQDNPEILLKAINYLSKHTGNAVPEARAVVHE